MAKLTLQDAERTAGRNRPWTIRLEFVGSNSSNQSGVSSKFWFATGRGLAEAVEMGWGAIGNPPQGYKLGDWNDLRTKVAEKLGEGYQYADTPFVRMSATNLAKLTWRGANTPPASTPPPLAPTVSAAVVSAVVAVMTAPVPVYLKPPKPGLVAMGQPYSLVRALKMKRTGLVVGSYLALDECGVELMEIPAKEGEDLARDYDLEIVFA